MRILHYYCLAVMLFGQLIKMMQSVSGSQTNDFFYKPNVFKRVRPKEDFLEDYFARSLREVDGERKLDKENVSSLSGSVAAVSDAGGGSNEQPDKTFSGKTLIDNSKNEAGNEMKEVKNLNELVQSLYMAQAHVQLEAAEIKKAQETAGIAQNQLEEASNQLRTISLNYQNAQKSVEEAVQHAQAAQLQLAAHDQLLFAARQDVDSLSSQIVGLQALDNIIQPKDNAEMIKFLEKIGKLPAKD